MPQIHDVRWAFLTFNNEKTYSAQVVPDVIAAEKKSFGALQYIYVSKIMWSKTWGCDNIKLQGTYLYITRTQSLKWLNSSDGQ